MNKIKVSSISMKSTPLDFIGNTKIIKKVLDSPEVSNSALVVFPEMCISGYGCEDAFYNTHVWKKSFEMLKEILPLSKDKVVTVGLPIFVSPFLYNCAAVLSNNKILGIVPKTHLANTGVHYEKRWFKDGVINNKNISIHNKQIPFGNFIFKNDSFSFSIEICEDSWVSDRPSIKSTHSGTDLVLSMGASHFSFNKQEVRKRIFLESSRNQNNAYIFSNLNGNESGRIIFEGGCLITQNGILLNEGKRLHFSDFTITNAVIDIDSIRFNKSKNYRSLDNNKYSDEVQYSLLLNEISEPLSIEMKNIGSNVYKDFSNAVCLGLFDYLIKTKSKGYSLSLSGGADSSAIAILVYLMKEKVKQELGQDIFLKYGIFEKEILYTIYQETENNSPETKKFAAQLAKDLSLPHYHIKIDNIIDSIINILSKELKIKPNWNEHDLALQNIQARVRSPIVWMMANLKNHLLLSTGNRSESSVGYTTMDGDSSGSLCPIAGVSKKFILEWLDYIQKGNENLLPNLKSLSSLLDRKPTAELKPLSETQEDEKDLMPYSLLQRIEEEFVFNGRDDKEILEVLLETEDYSKEVLEEYIKKFLQLFRRSQWKRERIPPGFHLDDYGLDPKSSFRYPILS